MDFSWHIASAKAAGLAGNSDSVYIRFWGEYCLCVFPKGHPYYHFGIFEQGGKTVATGIARSLSEAQKKCENLAAHAVSSQVQERAG